MSTFLAELVGTMILIVLGGGVVAGSLLKFSKAENGGWVLITIAWGFAVAIAAYTVGGISGAHINPALTIAFATIGELPWIDVPMYILAQLIGAIIGAVIVYLAYLPHWSKTEDADAKLSVFATIPAIRHPLSNTVTEMIGAFILLLGILALGGNSLADGINPLLVGIIVMAIGMSLGGPTGYAINPARDLGPRIAHFLLPIPNKRDSDWSYAFVPIIGPIIGGATGALFYKQFFLNESTVTFWVFAALFIVICIAAFLTQPKSTTKEIT
ncbi:MULTISPECIES: MIP/aquaporin family protein [unclassified Solibacillus]|uniref:MIP/aquaporin family protein n=1 Tax=unclassified Solibacillus TaxID=2637870 RepID=UPI0030F8E4B0